MAACSAATLAKGRSDHAPAATHGAFSNAGPSTATKASRSIALSAARSNRGEAADTGRISPGWRAGSVRQRCAANLLLAERRHEGEDQERRAEFDGRDDIQARRETAGRRLDQPEHPRRAETGEVGDRV